MHVTIKIHPIPVLKDNYVWTMINDGKAFIVDPGDAEPVKHYLLQNHLQLSGILLTHHHWDHTNGVSELKQIYSVPVFAGHVSDNSAVTNRIAETESIHVADFPVFTVFNIPGHTLDHVAYYASGIIFTGDTLFAGGCGRIFEGTAEMMYNTLQKIYVLPNDTRIYCGHEYTEKNLLFANLVEPNNKDIQHRLEQVIALRKKKIPSLPAVLSDEKATNPFLRCHIPEVIHSVTQFANQQLTSPVEVLYWLRKWKDSY